MGTPKGTPKGTPEATPVAAHATPRGRLLRLASVFAVAAALVFVVTLIADRPGLIVNIVDELSPVAPLTANAEPAPLLDAFTPVVHGPLRRVAPGAERVDPLQFYRVLRTETVQPSEIQLTGGYR